MVGTLRKPKKLARKNGSREAVPRVKGADLPPPSPTLLLTKQALRNFGLAESLGKKRWLKVFRLEDYAPRSSRQPVMLQQVLFTYTDAI